MEEQIEFSEQAEYRRTDSRGFIQNAVRDRCSAWGKQLDSTGESLATISRQLRTLGATPAADIADRVAGYTTDFASYLQTSELDTLLHDAETLARQQPFVVIAAGFVLGLAGARMLKVGSGRRYELYGNEPSWRS